MNNNKKEFLEWIQPLYPSLKSYVKQKLAFASRNGLIAVQMASVQSIVDSVIERAYQEYKTKSDYVDIKHWLKILANKQLKKAITRQLGRNTHHIFVTRW